MAAQCVFKRRRAAECDHQPTVACLRAVADTAASDGGRGHVGERVGNSVHATLRLLHALRRHRNLQQRRECLRLGEATVGIPCARSLPLGLRRRAWLSPQAANARASQRGRTVADSGDRYTIRQSRTQSRRIGRSLARSGASGDGVPASEAAPWLSASRSARGFPDAFANTPLGLGGGARPSQNWEFSDTTGCEQQDGGAMCLSCRRKFLTHVRLLNLCKSNRSVFWGNDCVSSELSSGCAVPPLLPVGERNRGIVSSSISSQPPCPLAARLRTYNFRDRLPR